MKPCSQAHHRWSAGYAAQLSWCLHACTLTHGSCAFSNSNACGTGYVCARQLLQDWRRAGATGVQASYLRGVPGVGQNTCSTAQAHQSASDVPGDQHQHAGKDQACASNAPQVNCDCRHGMSCHELAGKACVSASCGPPLPCSAGEARTPSSRHPVGQSEFPPEARLPAAQGAY